MVTEVTSLQEREWSVTDVSQFNKGHVTEVVTLMEGEWSCYGGGKFKRGRTVMLQRSAYLF